MTFLNFFSKTQSSNANKITADKVIDFVETYEELKPFFTLLVYCFKHIVESEKEIEEKIREIQTKTQQNLNKDSLLKELWIFRYACLHIWFFDLMEPKNNTELSDQLLVINSALKSVLKENNRLEYLPWLKDGLNEFTLGELNFNKLTAFKNDFSNKVAEKTTKTAFECTDGRLAGELHDFVIELFMTTMQKDRKIFYMSEETDLNDIETENIDNLLSDLNTSTENEIDDILEEMVEDNSENINPNRTGRFHEYSKTMSREEAIDVYKMWLLHVRYYHPKLDALFHGVSIPTFFLPVPMELLQETPEIIKEFTDEEGLLWTEESMGGNLEEYANRYYPRTGDDEEIIMGLGDAINKKQSLDLILQDINKNKEDWYFEYKEL